MKTKNTFSIVAVLFATVMMWSCGGGNTTENSENIEEQTEVKTEESVEITGFKTIEELAASVVESIKARDYESYYSHIMTEEMELALSTRIEDEKIRKEFLHEYGFSLHEEKEYFDNLLHYYDSKNIDLSKATLADMEYIEYKGGEYEPIMLYEVFIPIEMEYELLIDFTIIEVDGMYYLTSEIGI